MKSVSAREPTLHINAELWQKRIYFPSAILQLRFSESDESQPIYAYNPVTCVPSKAWAAVTFQRAFAALRRTVCFYKRKDVIIMGDFHLWSASTLAEFHRTPTSCRASEYNLPLHSACHDFPPPHPVPPFVLSRFCRCGTLSVSSSLRLSHAVVNL